MNAVLPALATIPPVRNRMLAALPAGDMARLARTLHTVQLEAGTILHEPGQAIRHLYFPNDSLISLLAVADGRLTLEIGLVGCEGLVGGSVVLGRKVAQIRAVVQQAGTASCIASAHFCAEFKKNPILQRMLHRYTDTMLTRVSQIAVCSSYHLVEARLARSLLLTRDRLQSEKFHITHEFLAQALGVRRVGVTKAASTLQQQKLIVYSRGNIEILDARGLAAVSCRCYEIIKEAELAHKSASIVSD